jgi:hypothetical protein
MTCRRLRHRRHRRGRAALVEAVVSEIEGCGRRHSGRGRQDAGPEAQHHPAGDAQAKDPRPHYKEIPWRCYANREQPKRECRCGLFRFGGGAERNEFAAFAERRTRASNRPVGLVVEMIATLEAERNAIVADEASTHPNAKEIQTLHKLKAIGPESTRQRFERLVPGSVPRKVASAVPPSWRWHASCSWRSGVILSKWMCDRAFRHLEVGLSRPTWVVRQIGGFLRYPGSRAKRTWEGSQ